MTRDELLARAEINGAARQVEQSPGEVAPITGTAGSIPAAAPPSTYVPGVGFLPTAQPSAQPVAVVLENRSIVWYTTEISMKFKPGTNLYTAPPDLAARVKELEAVLRVMVDEAENMANDYNPRYVRVDQAIKSARAALAKGAE